MQGTDIGNHTDAGGDAHTHTHTKTEMEMETETDMGTEVQA